MPSSRVQQLAVRIENGLQVSALLTAPRDAFACYVLAHGAGAGMTHPFLAAVAGELAERRLATLRFQFPYMERGSKRPDPPALCHAVIRAAVAEAHRRLPGLPLIAGGRSFGGRMTSEAQAEDPLAGVKGLAFLGFPLHPAGKPAVERARHLQDIRIPMLFLQGNRDALAEVSLLRPVVDGLGKRAALKLLEGADHAFHVPARSGRTDAELRGESLNALVAWAKTVVESRSASPKAKKSR